MIQIGTRVLFLFALLQTTVFTNLHAQNVIFDIEAPSDMTVCSDAELFTVEFTNIAAGSLENLDINIELPDGVSYVAGSLSEISSFNVQESNIASLNDLHFSSDDIEANETVRFTFEATAGFDAYLSHNAGNLFNNTITLNYDGGSDTEASSVYNIFYGALSITNIDPMSSTVFVGGTFTRTITIVNGGFGALSSFVLTDVHDASSATIDAVDVGVLNNNGSAIEFSATDFQNIGNGDSYFDQNEAITITETITTLGCEPFQSVLTTYWGCDGQTAQGNTKYPFTEVVLYAPSLTVNATPGFNNCVVYTPDEQGLTLTNNGNGPANELSVLIKPDKENQYTFSDISSITLTANDGTVTSLTPASTNPSAGYSCFGSNQTYDGFSLDLPNLLPGESVTLNWNNATCATDNCGSVKYTGWMYEVDYTDMCNSKNYDNNGRGQDSYKKNLKGFFESASTIEDGEDGLFSLMITTGSFDLPLADQSVMEVVFEVPNGLNWTGTASDLKIDFTSGTTVWNPGDVSFNNATKKLTVQYPMPMPTGFKLPNAVFDLMLTGDCSFGGGYVDVGVELFYVLDNDCPVVYKIPLICDQMVSTKVYCPGNCNVGLAFEGFEVNRVTMGLSDNDQDGIADTNNSLDYSKVKTNRVMVGDEFETIFAGTVNDYYWQYGRAQSKIPHGQEINIISARVEVYDASTGNTRVCNNVPFSSAMSGDIRVVDFNFSPSSLANGGCSDFNNFIMNEDDEVILTARYKVVDNPGGIIEQLTIENDFYIADYPTGGGYQCDDWNGNITLIGYYHEVYRSEDVDVDNCDKTIKQSYRMSIGACCNNFDGGNIFPYEFRNWATLNEVKVQLPEGYEYVSAKLKHWRTLYTNKSKMQTANIEPIEIVGNDYKFDLSSYYTTEGGTIVPSDDGWKARIDMKIRPECTLEEVIEQPVDWSFSINENTILGSSVLSIEDEEPDFVQHTRAKLNLSTVFETQEATGLNANWEVKVTCTDADAENGWFYFVYDGAIMNIAKVTELDTELEIAPVNGLFYIGDFSKNEKRSYQISVDYNNCDLLGLQMISGYDCLGYPDAFDDYECSQETLDLFVQPQPTEMQVKLNTDLLGNSACSDSMSIELELLSSKLSAVENIYLKIQQPDVQSIEIIPGSCQVLYPENNTYYSISDPQNSAGVYIINAADINADIGTNGLPGITDVDKNIVKVRFSVFLNADFKPGDFLDVEIGGQEPCGDNLPTLSLKIDPNASFERVEGIGLDEMEDDWGLAWADYNGDGFVDLFVSNYDVDVPNRLYRNNGNGTFTQETTGPVMSDMALSLAGTWGDYDNDGDIDLFITNNIGSKNFLYRNNGDGNFTKVLNDPIVNYDGYSHGAAWGDYDNDGFIDMFVVDYFSTRFNKMYHNNGDGTFSEVTTSAPVLENGSSVGAVWGDYNNDGRIDLFISNINDENNSLYKNLGNGNFEKITNGSIVNDGGKSVGASWADYDNDGDLDLFVSNAGDQDNFLYQNNGDETFTKITNGDIVNDGGHSHGSAWTDFDNDGDLDLFVSNDANNPNFLYVNDGEGKFSKVDNKVTRDSENSFGAAWADIDNDMDLDLYVVNHGGQANAMYINGKGKCQSKACVTLSGTNSNRCGIGAKIHVKANIYGKEVWQMREVSSQSGGGVGGQNEMKTMIGLGDATMIDSMIIEWTSGYKQYLTNVDVNDCMTIEEDQGGQICGIAYYDKNENCVQDDDEPGIPNLNVVIQPGNHNLTTDESGAYTVFVEPGTYTVNQNANDLWDQTCSASYTIEVEGFDESYCDNHFANIAIDPEVDLAIHISTTPHRIGFENLIAVTYCNMGTVTATNVSLELEVSDDMDLLESSIPWDLTRSLTAVWNDLGNLGIGESNTIFVKNFIDASVPVGTIITMEARINSNESETIIANNLSTNAEPAVGAFDPNDMLVSPEGYIENDQELIYTIRFQNVGNASASTVRIEDQLPEELDMETFQMGVASHAYRLDVEEDNKLIWTFENINMPDSATNEVASHGYVIFKIKPKTRLEDDTEIINSASIFFDNNPAIHTNNVTNIIGDEPETELANDGAEVLEIYPNPAAIDATIQILDQNQLPVNIRSVKMLTVTGQQLLDRKGLNQEKFTIERGTYPIGYYIVRVQGVNGKEYVKKLILQ